MKSWKNKFNKNSKSKLREVNKNWSFLEVREKSIKSNFIQKVNIFLKTKKRMKTGQNFTL